MPTFHNFGYETPNVQTRSADTRGTSSNWIAAEKLADTTANLFLKEMAGLREIKFQNALYDHEIHSRDAALLIQERVKNGEIKLDNSVEEYRKEVDKFKIPETEFSSQQAEALRLHIRKQRDSYAMQVVRFSKAAALDQAGAEFLGGLERLRKIAAYPDFVDNLGDLYLVAEEELAQKALSAGVPQSRVSRELRKFSEDNWTQHARSRLIKSEKDPNALKALQEDLMGEKGMYIGKLSFDRINGLQAAVSNQITKLEYKSDQIERKVEAASQKTLKDIEKQISTGIPATPEMWTNWADVVQGSQYEQEFDQLAVLERDVQFVLSKPIDEQQQYLREIESNLKANGGDISDVQNFNRFRSAIEKNIKQLENEPLLYSQARSGDIVPPLQLDMILDNDARPIIATQIDDRITTIRALQNRYGPQVKMRPLLPQEVGLLSSVLEQAAPTRQIEIFGALRKSFFDDEAYMAAMQQIAPDAPVKALAGMLMAKERNLMLERNWFSDDVSVTSGNVANILLLGESILNKTKDQKSQDGIGQSFPVPPQVDFDSKFLATVGDAFAGRPDAYSFAMQAVRSHYVGMSAHEGDLSGTVDNERMARSIRSVLGNVVEINRNGKVFAPWGMEASEFKTRANEAFSVEMKRKGMGELADRFVLFGLKNFSEDRYYVLQGRNYLLDNDGDPVVIHIPGRQQ